MTMWTWRLERESRFEREKAVLANPTTDAPSDDHDVSGNDREVSHVERNNFLGPSQQAEHPSLWPADEISTIDLG